MNTIQRNICVALTVWAVVVGVTATVQGQGKLGRVREAVRQSKPKQKPSHREKPKRSEHKQDDHDDHESHRDHGRHERNRSGHCRNRDRRCDIGPVISLGAAWFSEPAPVHVVQHHHTTLVTPSPVVVIEPEPVITAEPVVAQPLPQRTVRATYFDASPNFDWIARLSALGGTNFDDIAHGSLGLLIQARGGLGIDTSVTMFRESGMNVRDHLYLGDVNLTYEPVLASDRFRMRVGVGVNWLGDAYGGDAGFNMTGGLDWKLSQRWVMTGEADFGTIGDTDLTHAQLSVGRALSEQTELTFGYNYHDIGGVTMGSAFTGLRFRF